MPYVDIDAAFDIAYEAGAYGLSTAKEGVEFDTPDDYPYAELRMLPGATDVITQGDNGYDEHAGVCQITLHYEHGQGKGALLAKADEIRADFEAGTRLEQGSADVEIQSVDRFPIDKEGNDLRLVLSINWLAWVQR